METGAILGNIDVAQVVLYAFWAFFAGLIWYIRQEDRREGYPLENDVTGEYSKDPWLFVPSPKTFRLPHNEGVVSVPNLARDTREIRAERVMRASGSPLRPTGNPMLDGVGPASWAERADRADLTAAGEPRIVPLRADKDFDVAPEDVDPRGMRVIGCDGKLAGTVADLWVDRAEVLIRYLEVELEGDAENVLLPRNFCVTRNVRGGRAIYVNAITSEQFADVPKPARKTRITLLEEERIVAYFGGGQLYATPQRQESYL